MWLISVRPLVQLHPGPFSPLPAFLLPTRPAGDPFVPPGSALAPAPPIFVTPLGLRHTARGWHSTLADEFSHPIALDRKKERWNSRHVSVLRLLLEWALIGSFAGALIAFGARKQGEP